MGEVLKFSWKPAEMQRPHDLAQELQRYFLILMKRLAILVILALRLAPQLRAQAVAEGRVQLRRAGVPSVVNQRYEMNLDASVIAPDPPTAVVYLEGRFPAQASAPPRARMAQKNIAFETALLPVQVGTTVEFPNEDDTYHNIFSYSKPKRFDLGRYRKDEKPPTVFFDKAGPVALHCDIHEFMQAVILVLDTPYFVKTDLKGNYSLGKLPAGHYTLKAWVDSKTTYSRQVDLRPGATIHADFP